MFISTQFECDIQQLDYSPLSSHPARSDPYPVKYTKLCLRLFMQHHSHWNV